MQLFVRSMNGSPMFLKLAIRYVFKKYLFFPAVIFSSKNNGPTIPALPNINLWRIQGNFMQSVRVFSTPYSTVLSVNTSTQVEKCFVFKRRVVQSTHFFTRKTAKPVAILNSCSSITGLKLRSWTWFLLFGCSMPTCLRPLSLDNLLEDLLSDRFLSSSKMRSVSCVDTVTACSPKCFH